MAAEGQEQKIDFKVKTDSLFREEIITDLNIATIRKMVPVKTDGSDDTSRTEQFFGQTQLMSPQGPVPLHAVLPGNNLEEAIASFESAMTVSFNQMVERMKKAQEEQQKKQEAEKKD